MTFADILVIAVVVVVITFAALIISREKKKGAKCASCVGCAYSADCSKKDD